MQAGSVFLLTSVILSGFIGGIGVVNWLGYIPAMRKTQAESLLPYWQTVDRYMSSRMPVFGSLVLLSFAGTAFFIATQPFKQPLLLITTAFGFIVADIVIAGIYNLPFNRLIQRITPKAIPDNFDYYRRRAVSGFYLRSICMVGSFVATLGALFLQASRGLLY